MTQDRPPAAFAHRCPGTDAPANIQPAITPERVLDCHRRYRARLRESSLTFAELHRRVGGNPDVLRLVLADEVRRGTVERVQRRYRLNGHLPDDVRLALRDLEL